MKSILTILWNYLKTKYIRRFRTREQLLNWQNQQVRKYLQTVLPKSPFYRQYYQNHNIDNWQELPIIDKSIMMSNFDQLNTIGVSKSDVLELAAQAENSRNFAETLRGYTVGMSSGTSGNRGLFIVSQAEQQAWAGTILAKALPNFILTPQRIAFFLRANSNLYETVQGQRIKFQYFDLFQDVNSHIQKLQEFLPTILVSPPSMLRLLADAKIRGELNIQPIKIVSVAEVLDPLDEVYISKCFGQKIHQIYQCTEGFLGHTCEHGTLHLNEDILVIQKEYIDKEAGKFMPIITDFNRRTQPIIRYRLDDILTEKKTPCPCGSILTAVESLEGRKDDIFWLHSQTGETLKPTFPDFIRRAIIITSEEIQEYLVIQKNPDLIEVYLKVAAELRELIENQVNQSLLDLFSKTGCQIPVIHYYQYPERKEHHVKLRRVKREFTVNQNL
ncbi:MAG TPA: F390 synthetase-related protein [Nostocaceae cyanobacterium]|nr:F390 synthetase-related protein [Nostocaceae cyanobacterium]